MCTVDMLGPGVCSGVIVLPLLFIADLFRAETGEIDAVCAAEFRGDHIYVAVIAVFPGEKAAELVHVTSGYLVDARPGLSLIGGLPDLSFYDVA